MSVPEKRIEERTVEAPSRPIRLGHGGKKGQRIVSDVPRVVHAPDYNLMERIGKWAQANAEQIMHRITDAAKVAAGSLKAHAAHVADVIEYIAAGLKWDEDHKGSSFTNAAVAAALIRGGLIRVRGHESGDPDKMPPDEIKGRAVRYMALAKMSDKSLMSDKMRQTFDNVKTVWPAFLIVSDDGTETAMAFNNPIDALRTAGASFTDVYEAFMSVYRPVPDRPEAPATREEAAKRVIEQAAKRSVKLKTRKARKGEKGETITTVKIVDSVEATVEAIVVLAEKHKGRFTQDQHARVLAAMGPVFAGHAGGGTTAGTESPAESKPETEVVAESAAS